MRMFSIIQNSFALFFPASGQTQLIQFSEHPDDSSVVRMRITPPSKEGEPLPDDACAIEIQFDRNGRERSRREWPMRYPSWDTRDPSVIDKETEDRHNKEAEVLPANAADPTPAGKVGKRGR